MMIHYGRKTEIQLMVFIDIGGDIGLRLFGLDIARKGTGVLKHPGLRLCGSLKFSWKGACGGTAPQSPV